MSQRQERYFVGPRLRDKLREVIARVEGMPEGSGGGGKIPVVHQEIPRAAGGARMRLCKTSEEFPKGTVQNLDVWESGNPPNETQTGEATVQNVVNKYATIGANKWVSVALHGNGRWYVVAAECSEA
jgi:hypothetical protein